jgi:hypothetical protein
MHYQYASSSLLIFLNLTKNPSLPASKGNQDLWGERQIILCSDTGIVFPGFGLTLRNFALRQAQGPKQVNASRDVLCGKLAFAAFVETAIASAQSTASR